MILKRKALTAGQRGDEGIGRQKPDALFEYPPLRQPEGRALEKALPFCADKFLPAAAAGAAMAAAPGVNGMAVPAGSVTISGGMVGAAVNGPIVVVPPRQCAALHRTQRGTGAVAKTIFMMKTAVHNPVVIVAASQFAARRRAYGARIGSGLSSRAASMPAMGKSDGGQQGNSANGAQHGNQNFFQRHDSSTS